MLQNTILRDSPRYLIATCSRPACHKPSQITTPRASSRRRWWSIHGSAASQAEQNAAPYNTPCLRAFSHRPVQQVSMALRHHRAGQKFSHVEYSALPLDARRRVQPRCVSQSLAEHSIPCVYSLPLVKSPWLSGITGSGRLLDVAHCCFVSMIDPCLTIESLRQYGRRRLQPNER